MKNIVLIGMPGAGKSTIGVLLAKSLLMNFTDTDLIIQRQYAKSLCDIIDEKGREAFLKIENDVIASSEFCGCVVATGGSAVYGSEAMAHLKKDGVIIYLKLPVEEIEKRISNIQTRGVAMKKGTTLEDLYNERRELYEKYADYTLDCRGLSAEECVNRILCLF